MASDIDLKPTAQMASNAERGLALREKHGKGGTAVGVARARDIKNRKNLSPSTVRRMHSFFSRHDGNQSGGEDDAGYIAWMLWGGDAGQSWSKRKVDEMDNKSKNAKGVEFDPYGEANYENTHRVKPRGKGWWIFDAPDGSLVRVPSAMTYSEAKAWLKKNAPMPGRYKVATSRASGPGSKQKFGSHKVADYGPFQLWWVGDPGGSRYFQVKKGSMTIPFNDGDKAEQYIATHGGIGYIVQRAYKDFWNDGFGDFVTSHRAMDKLTKRDLQMFLKDAIEMYEDEEDTQMVAQAKKVMQFVSRFSRPGEKVKMGRAEKELRDGTVHLDFKAAEAWLQSLTDDQLRYIVQDARAAANAMPDGKKWNYYHDLALTAGDELSRRKRWDPARKKNLTKNDRPGENAKFDKSAEIRARYTALKKMPKSELFALWQRKMQRGRVDVGGKMNEMDKDWLASDIVNAEYNRRDVDAAFASSRPGAKAKFAADDSYRTAMHTCAAGLEVFVARLQKAVATQDWSEARKISDQLAQFVRGLFRAERTGAKAKFTLEDVILDAKSAVQNDESDAGRWVNEATKSMKKYKIDRNDRVWTMYESLISSAKRRGISFDPPAMKASRPGAKAKFSAVELLIYEAFEALEDDDIEEAESIAQEAKQDIAKNLGTAQDKKDFERLVRELRKRGSRKFSRPGAKAKFGFELERWLYDRLHRFFHHDERGLALLKKHGEQKVDGAISEAASHYSDLEEIGSSDMWIIIRSAIRNLGETPKFSRPGAEESKR